jgi:hypothetical protein
MSHKLTRWWLRRGRWMALILALGGFSYAYLTIGSALIRQTNLTDERILGGDQKNNIKLALQSRDDLSPDWSKGVSQPIKNWFPHRTDGVVNPLWPWVAGWLADSDHTISADDEVTEQDRALFHRGRWFHVGWTLGALLVLGIGCARVFSIAATLNIVLLAGFGALLPRAAYFQPEPLFFALFLLTWVACLFALHRNSIWMHLVMGVIGGLAYLAKESVQPLLLCYIAVSTLRWMWSHVSSWMGRPAPSTSLWRRRDHWMTMFVLCFSFIMTAGPRLSESQRLFGSALHSFPKYWMWFDDFKDCYTWMGQHNSAEKLASMTPETRPGLGWYLRTHTTKQAQERLVIGTQAKVTELLWPGKTPPPAKDGSRKPWKGVLELRGVYLGLVALVPALLALSLISCRKSRPINAAQRLHPETWTMVLLCLGCVVGYSLAYGWYHPIGRGDRFMLSLYMPLVLSLTWAGESLRRRAIRRGAPTWLNRGYHLAQWAILITVTLRIVELLQWPFFKA